PRPRSAPRSACRARPAPAPPGRPRDGRGPGPSSRSRCGDRRTPSRRRPRRASPGRGTGRSAMGRGPGTTTRRRPRASCAPARRARASRASARRAGAPPARSAPRCGLGRARRSCAGPCAPHSRGSGGGLRRSWEDPAVERDLRPLFEPRSVAIVGASNDPAKWGQWLARDALRGEHRRAVYLVNRSAADVQGRRSYPSLAELPEAPELVVLAVPAAAFEETLDASLEAGARAIVAIAAGLGEAGEEGRAREVAAVARVRAAGALLLGPNCLGVYDAAAELALGTDDFVPGPIGLASQS